MFTIDQSAAITIVQGDEGSFQTRRWVDEAKSIPEDLTGLTFTLKVAKSYSSPAVLTLGSGSGITVVGNVIEFRFKEEHTDMMKPGEYVYQVEMRGPGVSDTVMDSTFVILPQIK
jgi:hypothetical protein